MTQHISPTDLKLIDTQPRVMDLTLARTLQLSDPHKIRNLIKRNADELTRYGEVSAMVAETSTAGGRPSLAYWLNEPQSVLVCMFSDGPRAADARQEIISVFMDWRARQPAQPTPEVKFEFPGADLPLNEYMAKLATLKECRLIHGPRAAARLWRRLGMPQVTDSVIEEVDEGRACLAHLLAVKANIDFKSPNYESEITLRDDIESALDGDENAKEALVRDWLLLPVCGINDGLFVPNVAYAVFHNTPWAQGRHVQALRKLAGSMPMKKTVCGSQCRGTFVPATLIESIPQA